MLLYGAAGGTKRLRMIVNYQGPGGIRFNEVAMLADNRTQPVYEVENLLTVKSILLDK